MLPVTHGVQFTKLQIILYTIILILVSLLPFVVMMSGILYLISALILGAIFLYYAVRLYFDEALECFHLHNHLFYGLQEPKNVGESKQK